MTTGKLGRLLRSVGEEQFLLEYWPSRPCVAHAGSDDDLDPLLLHPWLQSVDQIASRWSRQVLVALPDFDDEYSSIHVSPDVATKLFRNGMTITFTFVNRECPIIQEWLQELFVTLRLPAQTLARAYVYASPDGRGTAPHFDHNANFVLQLKGTKVWRLAPNEHVVYPMSRYTMRTVISRQMSWYSRLPMPTEMPAQCTEVVLKPGSFLFVPRGLWHSTKAEGESLSLNFTFSQPSWLEIIIDALMVRLSVRAHWREGARWIDEAESSLEYQRLTDATLTRLLTELTEESASIHASDIAAASRRKRDVR